MGKLPRTITRITMLLIGTCFASAALAVATLEATPTGEKANETTIKLFDNTGKEVRADADKPSRFSSLTAGAYTAEVYVGGKQVGDRSKSFTIADGSNNRLRADGVTGSVELVPGDAMWNPSQWNITPAALTILGGGGYMRDAPTSIGVFQTTDTSLLTGKSQIPFWRLDGQASLLKDGRPGCVWDIGYLQGSASTSASILAGPRVGYSYWIPAPTGSTGLVSSGGADASLNSKFEKLMLNVALPYELQRYPDSTLYGEPEGRYQWNKWKYDGLITLAPGVSSTTNQRDKENDVAFGYGLRWRTQLANGVSLGIGGGFEAMYYWDRYDGTQNNLCAVCRTPVDNYTVSTNDSKNGWTWAGWVNATAGFPISKDATLDVVGRYRYEAKNSIVVPQTTPSDPAPHIGTDSRDNWSVQAGLTFKF